MSSLCFCTTADTYSAALSQVKRYRDFIDMAEIRLDLLKPEERLQAGKFPGDTDIPLILTIRLVEDGGHWGNQGENERERIRMFETLLSSGGWDFVDLEYGRSMKEAVRAAGDSGTRIIRSLHDFQGTLLDRPVEELAGKICEMAEDGSIPKIAARCKSSRHLLTLARTSRDSDSVKEKVFLGMGEYGSPSRILAQRTGSLWTYTSQPPESDDTSYAAPGQLDPETLERLYRFRDIDEDTPIYAVIGNPIAHSRSPHLHNRWLGESGMKGTYIPIRTDDFNALKELCELWGIRGLSVTVPHKKTALDSSDYQSSAARAIGAANTLIRGEKGWRAENTDAAGFLQPLLKKLGLSSASGLKGKKAVIVGAGGASRAAVHALVQAGMSLVILNRTVEKARILAEETGQIWGPLSEESSVHFENGVELLIQTTTVGMHPHSEEDPLPWWNPGNCALVYDMIYQPAETLLMSRARAAGVKTMNGSEMLEAQARLQFSLFTGKEAPD